MMRLYKAKMFLFIAVIVQQNMNFLTMRRTSFTPDSLVLVVLISMFCLVFVLLHVHISFINKEYSNISRL